MKKKVFSLMMMLLLAFTGFVRADELTVHDGTATNSYVPVYGFYADAYLKCEMVYPASELSVMNGGQISSMTFGISSPATEAWTATFEVFVKEVSDATVSDFTGTTGATTVYTGTLDGTGSTMTVNFTAPYTYNGGNLLVGFYTVTTGNYKSVSWAGETVSGASVQGYSYTSLSSVTASQRDFLPKTTFTYTGGGGAGGEIVEVTIGDPASTSSSSYLPTYSLYEYSLTQQIYTADEIGVGGAINSLTMWLKNTSSYARNLNFYLKEANVNAFAGGDWVSMSSNDLVGSITLATGISDYTETTINLSTPFEYTGNGNLVLCVQDVTGSWSSGAYGNTLAANGNQAIYAYRDGTVYDPTTPGVSGYTLTNKNVLRLSITTEGGGGGQGGFEDKLHVKYMEGEEEIIDSLNLGVRPAGYWMAPFNFTMYTEGPTYTVNVLDFTPSDGMFTVEGEELPFQVASEADVELMLSVNASTTDTGVIERQFVAITEGDRAAHIWPIVVELYAPEVPDVWELAYDFGTVTTGFTYAGAPAEITPTVLHNDYTLPFPEIPEGEDGVYKFTVENDVIISAYVGDGQENALENGKVALYTEDFYGEGGPMATNNYTGLSVGAGGGAAGAPFEAQIGEGTSTSGYFPFYSLYNYSIAAELFLAAELEEAGVTTAPFTSLSWNATNSISQNQQNITIWMANVPDTQIPATSPLASGMTKVYTGDLNQPTPTGWVEFVFNEGSFSWDGHSNVMILCQRNNGEWTSSIQWQYHNPGFAARGYDYTDNAPYDVTTTAYSWYTSSTTRANIIMKGGNRSATSTVSFNFEGGVSGWTDIDNDGDGHTWFHSSNSMSESGYDYTGLGHNTSDGFMVSASYNDMTGDYYDADNYLVSPQKYTLGDNASVNFFFDYGSDNYPDYFEVCVATADNPGASDFTSIWNTFMRSNAEKAQIRHTNNRYENWREVTVDLSTYAGQDVWIAFHHQDIDYYEVWIDDVTINTGGDTPTPTPTPGPAVEGVSAGPVITNLGLTPGTYYLVASNAEVEEEPEMPQPRIDGGETEDNFFVYINIDEMPCPAIEAEGFAFSPEPADDADEIEPASVTLRWMVPEYATGWRLVFGSTYYPDPNHPQTIMYPEDGSFSNEMANSYTVRNLWNNTNYFWHVEFNNDACPEGVSSPIWGFTTHLNIPQNLTVVDETVFNDENIVLNWTAVVDRTYRFYNVYRDGELIGHTNVNDISNTTYTDGPLAYNMEGYTYYVTAVYDEGESAPSNTVTVKVSGRGNVNGHVYEQDGTTGIANATVTMVGQDEFGVSHTYNFQTNAQGYYSGAVYAGPGYDGQAAKEGYQTAYEPVQGEPIVIVYNETTSPIDYILDENFDPVCQVIAEYYPDSLDPNSPYVKVYWGCGLPGSEIIEDFETGDFSMFDWQVDGNYPWSITTYQPYEGTYCMKSGGAGVPSVVSNMTVTVDIPADGIMSYYGKISCESSWDYGYFYIDGVQKAQYTGVSNWAEKHFDITAGTHTFQWQYTKDASVNSNDDCFYVDYITFYKQPEPPQPAQPGWHTYAEGDFNNAVGSNVGTSRWAYEYPVSVLGGYAGFNMTKVSLFSDNMYSAVGGNYTCTIYQGGNEPMEGTAVSTITVDVPANQNAWVDFDLTTPVSITGSDKLWVVWTANSTVSSWPAGCCDGLVDEGTWWSAGIEAGYGWEHETYGTWTMRQYFTNREGRGFYSYASENAPVAVETPVVVKGAPVMPVKGVETVTTTCANPNAAPGARVANVNRSLNHYRVYRTNCYNDGPYTEENTVLLATVWVPDTVYIDVEWADLPAGIYKWGVGAVYEGNRGEMIEAPINWAAPVAINRSATADNDPNPVSGEEGVRAPWDLMTTFTAPEAAHYGVVTDGQYIYTSNWGYASATHNFYKYDMQGNMIEGFEIPGCGTLRGMTFDGQHIYGVANSNTVYCVDLNSHTLVSTFTTTYGAMRGISYDPERDGFWVIGNWTGNLTLINRQGAVQFTGPTPTSVSDLAYYKDENDVEHVFCFNNGDNGVYDYNITTNTLGGSVFNFSATPGFNAGTSGGCHVAEYNGKVAFFGDLQQDPNLIGIYELRDGGGTPGPGPGPAPTPGNNLNQLALPRESETIWSNCLDKDMWLNGVTVNVLLNSADSPEGTTVDFTNLNPAEQDLYPVSQLVLDESGFYAFESFRRGEYAVNVRHEGYEPINDTVSIWENTDLRYVMTEIFYGIENLYVSRTGWAMWDDSHNIPGGGGGGGGQGGGQGDTFSVDFEAGMPAGWTTIDGGNPAGYGWQLASNKIGTGNGHNGSTDCVLSQSYDNNYGVIYPDNYLVSPAVNIAAGSTFSFYACAQDESYAAEHFGVFVSDNGTSNWTAVQEWTMTAKGSGVATIGRDGRQTRQGSWHEYSVDLSAFAGTKYIAIRHFNCSDMFYLDVDDIALTSGAKSGDRHLEYYKVMCTSIDGVPIFNHNTVYPFCQLSTNEPYNAPLVEGEHYLCKVACMYTTGLGAWSEPVEWVYEPCDHWGPVDEVAVNTVSQGNHIEWVFEHGFNPYGGETPGPGPGPQPGAGDWYYYDNGVNVDAVGLTAGGSFYWGVMFPAGSYTGNMVTKVSMYDYSAHTGTILIYQGGTTAPGTLVGQQAYSCTGSEDFVEWEFTTPVTIDPTQNLWIVMNNNNGQYVASACDDTGNPNGRWVSIDGTAWEDIAGAGLPYTWMIRAYVAAGAKGEPQAISYNGKSSSNGTFAISGNGPRVRSGESVHFSMISESALQFNIADVNNYDGRVYFLHKLMSDSRFSVINGEQPGMFIVSANSALNLEESFADFAEQTTNNFARMDKYAAADYANEFKGTLPASFINNLMMDLYIQSRENNLCELADPFCTDNGMYEFPAGVNAGSGETGPDYDCLYTTPNPAWYYMRIGNPGDIDIYMYSTPSVDIDFCCWGPFEDPTTPCPYGLTEDKVVSCSYSAQPTEHCLVPATAQTGEYYILVITNYSNQTCNINFSKVSGSGDTDCGILPPTDIIGFLITMDGEYLAFADPTDRDFMHEGEFGEHEYCVRPIYPGEMTLPDHNYGWSMGCPVCAGGGDSCEPGAPIYGEALNATDQVKIWWGEQNPGPGPGGCEGDEFSVNFESGMPAGWQTIDADGDGNTWTLGSVAMGAGYGHNGSSDLILSKSYDNNSGALHPDNYLVSPEVTLCEGSVFSFWACAQDASWAAEHFGVAVSNDSGEFEMVQEWTMTAKGQRYDGPRGTRDQGNWYQYTVDLSSYAGEGRFVAIRHFNCTDMFYLDVDDIELSNGAKNRAGIENYNVYRATSAAGEYALIGVVPAVAGQTYYEYIDTPEAAGTYYYQVRADYGDCLSLPAVSGENPSVDYVSVQTTGIIENNDNVALYPNPTKGNVTIEAAGMSRITVVSMLGQVVFDTELDANTYTLNMSQFNAGMYMVRVYTENGVAIKRVTVMQ